MRSLLAGRSRWFAVGAAGVAIVVLVVVLTGGSGGHERPYPEPGDVAEVADRDELGFGFIRDFVIGSDDTMYLAVGTDDDPREVIAISAKGGRSTVVKSGKGGAGITAARALALGRDDLLYVADADGQAVITRSRTGKVTRIGPYGPADGAPDAAPGLSDVKRMTVDRSTGDVYLADEHKIDRLGADGKLTTVAGARRPYLSHLEPASETFAIGVGPETGPAATFRFEFLQGIAFVSDTGDLYAVDLDRLVKIDRQGVLTVLPPGETRFGDALTYDPGRKNLYTRGEEPVDRQQRHRPRQPTGRSAHPLRFRFRQQYHRPAGG